jgi:hypothetical protein
VTVYHPAIYKKDTGEIVQTGMISCDPFYIDMHFAARLDYYGGSTHDVVDAQADPSIHYITILDGQEIVTQRPELFATIQDNKRTLLADGTDTVVLTGLPDPCEIIIDDPDADVETTVQTVSGGGFVFTADDPGVYTIEIRRFPFLPFKIEFTAI